MASRKIRPDGSAVPDTMQLTHSLRAQLKAYSQFAPAINSTLKDVNQIHTELDVEMKPINLVKGRLDRSYDLVGEQTNEELRRIDAAIETLDALLKVPTTIAPSPAPTPPPHQPPSAAAPTPTGAKRGPYKKRIRPDGSTSSAAPSPSNSAAPSPAAYPSLASPSSSSTTTQSLNLARSTSTTSTSKPKPAPIAPAPLGKKAGAGRVGTPGGKSRKDLLAAQLPLQPGRQVAFRQVAKGQDGKGQEEWILARILSVTDKNRYVVEDVDYDPLNPTPDGGKYATTLRSIVPLPDRRQVALTYPEHDYPPGTQVMALYPDTTSFYRAVIVGGPVPGMAAGGQKVKKEKEKPSPLQQLFYRLKFDDDDDNVREVAVELVVEIP